MLLRCAVADDVIPKGRPPTNGAALEEKVMVVETYDQDNTTVTYLKSG